MDSEARESELWQNYKSMADNLLSLTASLPVTLKHRAIDDLKKRLPEEVSSKMSLCSSEKESEDRPTPDKPKRKRGRPPKKLKQDVTAVSKEATSAEPHLEKSKTVTAGDFVIRTRRQRHVEQFGEEDITERGYRSPIVALLKSRSRTIITEKGDKLGESRWRKSHKEPPASRRTLKGNTKKHKGRIHHQQNGDSVPEQDKTEASSVLLEDKEMCESSQNSASSERADPDTALISEANEGRIPQQDISRCHVTSQASAAVVADSNQLDNSSEAMNGSESPKCGSHKEDSFESTETDLSHAAITSDRNGEVEQTSDDCKPSQVVILKRVPPVLPPGSNCEEPSADDGQENVVEPKNELVKSEPGFVADDGNISFEADQDAMVTTQRTRRGRKRKTTADYKCPECPKMLRSRDILREHLKSHRSQYKCETCGRKFVFRFKYEAHRQVHESGNFHKCPHCANMVMGRDRLEQHIRHRHPGLEVPEACLQVNSENNTNGNENSGPAEASFFGETSSVNNEATEESIDRKPEDWPPSETPDHPTETSAATQRRRMNHVCYECKQVFRSSRKLQLHQKTVHSRVVNPCYICSRRFLYRASYDEHMDDHKKGLLKQCSADGCTFYYKTESELQKHNDRIHSKSAPRTHVCQICNRSFWEARYLKQHMQNHDKSKTYVCQTCNFVSYNLMSLRRHLISHHEMKLAHVCDLCGAKLCSKNTLHDHIKRHLNQKTVVCEVCSKAFINRSQLAMHMRIHKNPRYSCSVCGKKSRTGNKLISHMLIHTKEKPYACLVEYCNYRCRVKSNLYKHMERVHKVQHPDKYKNYRYVEQLNNCAVEVVDNAESQPETAATTTTTTTTKNSTSATVADVLYVCAFKECSYQALTQDDVAKHQLHAHAMLSDTQTNDTLFSDETSLSLSELPIDGSLACGVDVAETFESITIPVPVEEISDQTEAAHTLAQLQAASIVKDDTEQDLTQTYNENLELTCIKKETCSQDGDSLVEMDTSPEDNCRSAPYPKLDDILTHTNCPSAEEDVTLGVCSQDAPMSGVEINDNQMAKTVYIVHVDDQEGSTTDFANYVELFAKSNVINFEPGTILVNEQGSVVSVIK